MTGGGLAHYADGTTNFVHGFPLACISLGLIDQRVPVLGVIYNPFLEHLYTGVRGAGSFLHTHTPAALGSAIGAPQRLPLAPASGRPLPTLSGALIAVEWGSDRAQEPIRCQVDSFARLAGAPPQGVMAHSLRSVGSAALNFALVAQGALDLYWCVSFAPLSLFSFFGDILLVGGWASVIIVIVGLSEPGTCSFIEIVVMSTTTMTRTKHRRLTRQWDVCVRHHLSGYTCSSGIVFWGRRQAP